MKLTFLQRYNRCEMLGNIVSGKAKPLLRDDSVYPCFYKAFRYMDDRPRSKFKITYKLHICKQYDGHYNNFAVLSKKDMCRLLNAFKQIIPFKFHFEDLENEYVLILDVKGTGLQNKALLMLSRALFEFPHNMCGADALKLRALGHLGDLDISSYPLLNLYLLCLSSSNFFSLSESFINDIRPTLLPLQFWREHLNVIGKTPVSSLTPYKRYQVTFIKKPSTIEAITSTKAFKSRVAAYTSNLISNLNA